MAEKNKKRMTDGAKAVKPHKAANIIVGIVVGLALLVIVAIIVMCSVSVDPMDGLKRPKRYYLYNLNSSDVAGAGDSASQSKIYTALGKMDFSVMSAVLQGNWDYSYNFVRDSSGKKIEMTAKEVNDISATGSAFMVEFEYDKAEMTYGEINYKSVQKLEVDGENVYFDRVKVLIHDTNGEVGEIKLYPYIYDRVRNQAANDGITYDEYRITAVKVRANTSAAFADLQKLAESL